MGLVDCILYDFLYCFLMGTVDLHLDSGSDSKPTRRHPIAWLRLQHQQGVQAGSARLGVWHRRESIR